jgi:cell division septation protein DedD
MRFTTIGLSAAAHAAQLEAPPSNPTDWKKRLASTWIPAILGVGLLMAFAYVGVRIVAGKPPVQAANPPASPMPATMDAPPVSVPSAPAPKPARAPKRAPAPVVNAMAFTVVTPQPGERYLQVAAVSPHMVLTYVDNLRIANLEAVIAPGPTPDLLRVLVGPFAERDSLDKAKAQLEASGKSPIIHSY